ncbi:MAG: hypothetical protein KDE64_12430 [Rhodocyclaceae bacterium]|nr:hypothetical protein [Rhodocyclaceae bacterium]
MHPEIQELAKLLERIHLLLAKYGEKHWSAWLARDARLIRNLDLYGVEHFLSAFGGMGSINDLVLHPINDHQNREGEIDAANIELGTLLEEAYKLGKKLYAEKASER